MVSRAWLTLLILPLLGCIQIFKTTFPQDLPVTIYIDEAFTEDEREEIFAAMDNWNTMAGDRLEEPKQILIFGGLVPHVEFTYPLFVDGVHVVYKIDQPVPDIEWLQSTYKYSIAGYATKGDVLILCYKMFPETIGSAKDWAYYLWNVRRIAVHELGHLLGLSHFNNVDGVMNRFNILAELTENDLDAFCTMYNCKDGG